LTREAIRDKYCGGSWDTFNSMLSETPPGNEGCIGLYYTICEIIPNNVTGCYYYSGELGLLTGHFFLSIHLFIRQSAIISDSNYNSTRILGSPYPTWQELCKKLAMVSTSA